MPKSFQIALWIVVGLFVVLGVARFVLYYAGAWLLKLLVKAGQSMNRIPARRISLLPRDDLDWSRPEETAQSLQELQQAGFIDAGRYEIKEIQGMKLQGLVHEELRIGAIVYDHKLHSMIDVVVHYEDGREFCYSNHTLGFSTARPEHIVQRVAPCVSASELLAHLRNESAKDGRRPIPADRFAFWIEERYAAHARWMAERGGSTLEETAAAVQAGGHKTDPETIREMYEQSATGHLEYWLRDQPDVTEKVWSDVEFELTVIHDGLRLETVLERFNAVVPEDEELKLTDIPAGVTNPRRAFAVLNERAGMPFHLFKEKNTGLPADFYLEAAGGDEENSKRAAA